MIYVVFGSAGDTGIQMQIDKPWGKIQFDANGAVEDWRPLESHCRDVAAVFAALLKLPGFRRRLAKLAGREALDAVSCARLALLTYLHDFGKVNAGFQARSDVKAPIVGHIRPLAALFGEGAPDDLHSRAAKALRFEELQGWGEAVFCLLDAALSHHGTPWPSDGHSDAEAKNWRAAVEYDPFAALSGLVDDAVDSYRQAFELTAAPLPAHAGFVHAYAGLVQLADWIASSDWRRKQGNETLGNWAHRKLREIGLDPEPCRAALENRASDFEAAFGFEPRDAQLQTASVEGELVILESETGSGKTEAALWRFLSLFQAGAVDGLYFALPTRTAAVQLHARVEKMARRLWPEEERPPVVLAVPGYLEDFGEGGLPVARDDIDAADDDRRDPRSWAAEHPKRYFAATISVGSIDQALLGAIKVKHAHMRAAMLTRHLLVVDEVHASDVFMRRILMNLLRDHLAAGGHALLLSATLGAEARAALMCEAAGGRAADMRPSLEEAIAAPYPLITAAGNNAQSYEVGGAGFQKEVAMEQKEVAMEAAALLDDAPAIARLALEAAERGAKTLVLRNTVSGAVEAQKAIEIESLARACDALLFSVEGFAALHHGRFAREDRRLLDQAVEKAVGKERSEGGLVLVGTQTLEQSLDIDADFLITDLCPADVLLQRIGRLHRHRRAGRPAGFKTPRCVVLTPPDGAPFLGARRPGGKPRHGLGFTLQNGARVGVYRDVVILEATRRLVTDLPVWSIPAMNRLLVESAMHRQAIEDLIANMDASQRNVWRRHWQDVSGAKGAEAQAAAHVVLRRNLAFRSPENRFDLDEHIATRLGAKDRLVDLAEDAQGPFGKPIRRMSIPGWMAAGLDPEEVSAGMDPPKAQRSLGNARFPRPRGDGP